MKSQKNQTFLRWNHLLQKIQELLIQKTPKTITQQPNKTNLYTGSKTVDGTLQLDVIKRNNLPKNCSQCYETKILDSNKYDEQLNLTRSSIKIELFEITKEF